MAKDLYVPVTLRGNKIKVKAFLGQTVVVVEGPEVYTGSVIVTPSKSEQTLQTKDKLLMDNVIVEVIPPEYIIPTGSMSITENGSYNVTEKESVNVDVQNEDYDNALTAFGVQSDLADGITALTEYSNEITGEADETLSDAVRSLADMTVEKWDGILYPADEEGRFNGKWLYLNTGDAVEVEFYGRGGRIWAFSNSAGRDYPNANRGENPLVMQANNKGVSNEYCYMKMRMRINPVTGPCVFSAAGYEWTGDGSRSTNDNYVFFGEYYKYKIIHAE